MNSNKNIFLEQQLLAIRLLDIYNPETKIRIKNLSSSYNKGILPSPDNIYQKEIVKERDPQQSKIPRRYSNSNNINNNSLYLSSKFNSNKKMSYQDNELNQNFFQHYNDEEHCTNNSISGNLNNTKDQAFFEDDSYYNAYNNNNSYYDNYPIYTNRYYSNTSIINKKDSNNALDKDFSKRNSINTVSSGMSNFAITNNCNNNNNKRYSCNILNNSSLSNINNSTNITNLNSSNTKSNKSISQLEYIFENKGKNSCKSVINCNNTTNNSSLNNFNQKKILNYSKTNITNATINNTSSFSNNKRYSNETDNTISTVLTAITNNSNNTCKDKPIIVNNNNIKSNSIISSFNYEFYEKKKEHSNNEYKDSSSNSNNTVSENEIKTVLYEEPNIVNNTSLLNTDNILLDSNKSSKENICYNIGCKNTKSCSNNNVLDLSYKKENEEICYLLNSLSNDNDTDSTKIISNNNNKEKYQLKYIRKEEMTNDTKDKKQESQLKTRTNPRKIAKIKSSFNKTNNDNMYFFYDIPENNNNEDNCLKHLFKKRECSRFNFTKDLEEVESSEKDKNKEQIKDTAKEDHDQFNESNDINNLIYDLIYKKTSRYLFFLKLEPINNKTQINKFLFEKELNHIEKINKSWIQFANESEVKCSFII